jgi:hypothetical protein
MLFALLVIRCSLNNLSNNKLLGAKIKYLIFIFIILLTIVKREDLALLTEHIQSIRAMV